MLVVDDLALGSSGRVQGAVRERLQPSLDRSLAVATGTSMIVATGTRARELDGITTGVPVGVAARVQPLAGEAAEWQNLRGAIPGAGLLIRDSVIQPVTQMSDEGINRASTRRARTAAGRLADGSSLLMTVDEGAGWSAGLTLVEMAEVMQELGAVEAVALDGGGSTTMAVAGAVRNQSSDLQRDRLTSVGIIKGRSGSIFDPGTAVSRAETATLLRRAIMYPAGSPLPNARDTFVDDTGSTHESAIDQLASAKVIGGIGGFEYAPTTPAARAAMSSLVMRASDLLVEQDRTAPPVR